MSVNGAIYRGDDPQWAAQVEKNLADLLDRVTLLESQNAYLKGSTR